MIDNRLVEDVQLKLKPHHFFEPLHGRIYEAILRLTDSNRIANPVTLKPLFDGDEGMKEVGGPAYLAQLTGSGAAVIGARDFASQIYDLALLRALVGVGRELVEGALDTSEDVAPLAQIERAETELYKVAEEGGAEGKAKSFAEATREALEMAEKALNSGGHLSGFTTGLEALNAKMGGLHKSDLIIVAGRPGMGKSALGTNMAFAAARRFLRDSADGIEPAKSSGAPVVLFSLEMSADQLATRILSEQSGITSENLRTGKITQQEFRDLARAAAELESLPLYIDDTPGLTIAALRTRARRLKRQKGIGMIVVDYLQLLQGSGRGGQREPSPGNLGDQPRPEAARQGARCAGHRLCRSSAGGRAARGQAAAALRPSGIGLDRAGRGHRHVHLPRGLLSEGGRARHADAERDREARQIRRVEREICVRRGQGRGDHRQAAPRLDRHRPASASMAASPSSATPSTKATCPRCAAADAIELVGGG